MYIKKCNHCNWQSEPYEKDYDFPLIIAECKLPCEKCGTKDITIKDYHPYTLTLIQESFS